MNPIVDEATIRQKLSAFLLSVVRITMGLIAWMCSARIFAAFAPQASPKPNDGGLMLLFGAIIGAALITKYFEDMIFVSRHGCNLGRWFHTGLRRPLRRFIPNLTGTFIGFNIANVLQGRYWELLSIFPWTIIWVALGAGYGPVLRRVRSLRKAVTL